MLEPEYQGSAIPKEENITPMMQLIVLAEARQYGAPEVERA